LKLSFIHVRINLKS